MVNYINYKVFVRKRLSSNNWESFSNAIELKGFYNIKVSKGIGKKKDIFSFNIENSNKKLFETYFSGDGTTTNFTLKYYPIPSDHLTGNNQKFFVYLKSGSNWVQQEYSTDYTISGSSLIFTTVPSSGSQNIKVEYPVLETDDIIRIYRFKNTDSYTINDILDEGTIVTPAANLSSDSNTLTIDGESFISILLNALAFVQQDESATKKSHEIIQDVINQVNEYNQDRELIWVTGNFQSSQNINYNISYKSAIEIIDELSTSEFNYDSNGNQVDCIFYVLFDGTNYNFYYKQNPTTTDLTLNESDKSIISIKSKKSMEDVTNCAIFNAGTDCEGNAMEFPIFDFSATGGGRWIYITKTNTIGESLINQEFLAHQSVWDYQDTPSAGKVRTSNYPNNYTGYETVFFDRNGDGTLKTTKVQPSNDQDFNNAIWNESYWRGLKKARDLLSKNNSPRYSLVISLDYGNDTNTNSYTLGNIYELNVPSFGLYNEKLRLEQIDYADHLTILYLKEDLTI